MGDGRYTIAFAGSVKGMSRRQKLQVRKILKRSQGLVEFRTGRFKGADEEARKIAHDLKVPCVVQVMSDGTSRGMVRRTLDGADALIACPGEACRRQHGTQRAIDIAVRAGMVVHIIPPDTTSADKT